MPRTQTQQRMLEALDRTVSEMEALQVIYGEESFTLLNSTSEWKAAQWLVEQERQFPTNDATIIHGVRLDARLDLLESEGVQLSLGFPPGYPDYCAARVHVLQWTHHTRTECERVTQRLQNCAETLLGQEAVMYLVHELQAIIAAADKHDKYCPTVSTKDPIIPRDKASAASQPEGSTTANTQEVTTGSIGRRWIWVHHITDNARQKAIRNEARELRLGGYLKVGYPGVIVIEGQTTDCDAFVSWIKGSKSRPGGFGRNWGHHVRGEINLPPQEQEEGSQKRCFPLEFAELQDMRDFGAACKAAGVEDEFLTYVMQHH